MLAGKVTKVQRSYKQWFALANWTGLPGVVAVLPAIPLLLTSNTLQMDMATAISPLSLNALIFHRAMGEPGYNLYTNLNLVSLFTIFLVVLGIKMWSGRSWLFALLYVLLPLRRDRRHMGIAGAQVGQSRQQDRVATQTVFRLANIRCLIVYKSPDIRRPGIPLFDGAQTK